MVEAEKISELHQEVKNRLVIDDFEKVKNWQKDSYHKQMMGGFKETKEAEESFKKAQKPWAKKLKEVSARVRFIKLDPLRAIQFDTSQSANTGHRHCHCSISSRELLCQKNLAKWSTHISEIIFNG